MATTTVQYSETTYQRPLLDRAFFGKDTCLTVQIREGNCYLKWGKKTGDQWSWKSTKFNDVELGDIIRLLEGTIGELKLYHSYNDESTQIWMSRVQDKLILKAGEYTKSLLPGEQKVLAILLSHSIWMMNVT